jgi:hypothetical protein
MPLREKAARRDFIIFRFEKIDAAIDVLVKAGVRLLSGEEVYAI